MNNKLSWDIFCRVIDNFGDIGVCWRLARQLAGEFNQSVRLWVDDLESLRRIWPAARLSSQQLLDGVEVRHWSNQFPVDVKPAQVVIEAFACDIPDAYLQAMTTAKAAGRPPLWINLEYLSAEPWVEGCHLMTSVHPSTGLRKRFFFPGFTSATGGLLREGSLPTQQRAFDKSVFLAELGIQTSPGALLISLFAYENESIQSLIKSWSNSVQAVHCLIPEGKILTSINTYLPEPLTPDNPQRRGSLCLQSIPFLTQAQYDLLLWACDINFVRGEDSFVRAQWAGKPFIWHIYPQDEAAHRVKLNAFLDLFTTQKDEEFTSALIDFWRGWNEHENVSDSWNVLASQISNWRSICEHWRKSLYEQDDLASQLMNLALADAAEKTTTEKPQTPV